MCVINNVLGHLPPCGGACEVLASASEVQPNSVYVFFFIFFKKLLVLVLFFGGVFCDGGFGW